MEKKVGDKISRSAEEKRVRDWMHEGVITCRGDTPVEEVAKTMETKDISALVVTDHDGHLEGIITHTDLLRAHVEREDWAGLPVAQYMTTPVITTTVDDHLSHVARMLLEKRIHRVVVVREEDGKQRPVAVLSESDLVYYFSREN